MTAINVLKELDSDKCIKRSLKLINLTNISSKGSLSFVFISFFRKGFRTLLQFVLNYSYLDLFFCWFWFFPILKHVFCRFDSGIVRCINMLRSVPKWSKNKLCDPDYSVVFWSCDCLILWWTRHILIKLKSFLWLWLFDFVINKGNSHQSKIVFVTLWLWLFDFVMNKGHSHQTKIVFATLWLWLFDFVINKGHSHQTKHKFARTRWVLICSIWNLWSLITKSLEVMWRHPIFHSQSIWHNSSNRHLTSGIPLFFRYPQNWLVSLKDIFLTFSILRLHWCSSPWNFCTHSTARRNARACSNQVCGTALIRPRLRARYALNVLRAQTCDFSLLAWASVERIASVLNGYLLINWSM